jgi:glycosyltransferase involved in cell wall biosynthesis
VKLGFILEPRASNSYYRVISPMRALERRGHEVIWPPRAEEDAPLRALLGCDLVHCYRRLDRFPALKELSSRGVAISFDNDDYLAAVDVSSTDSGGRISGAKGRLQNIRKFNDILKIARAADLATTPSEALAARYRAAGAENVTVIENYLDRDTMPGFGVQVRHAGIVIGWIAAIEHEADIPHLTIVDALERLLDRHADLRVLTVGSRLPLSSDRYEYLKPVPFDELVDISRRMDIGIAPLADTDFNRARSNIKLKEYAAGGAVWVASAVGPYRQMCRGQGGRLVEDENWFDALDGLIRSRFKRRRLAREALRWARSQTIDKHAAIWEEALAAAIDRAQARAIATRAASAR